MLHAAEPVHSEDLPRVDPDGTIHVPAFALPESSFLDTESRSELARERQPSQDAFTLAVSTCPTPESASFRDVAAIRRCQARAFEATLFYRNLRKRYPVTVTSEFLGGVHIEVVVPQDGVAGRVVLSGA